MIASTTTLPNRPRAGSASVVVSIAILVQLALVRLAFWSDGRTVLFLGAPFGADCWVRTHFGFPCPACGLTRSVTLTLYGNWSQAMTLHPAGPLAVAGLSLFAGGLFWTAVVPWRRDLLLNASLLYAGVALVWWTAWWIGQVKILG